MPRGDGTGPLGQGPRTGRAAGYCAGYNVPGYMNPAPGRGFGGRGGRGRGFRWAQGAVYPPAYPVQPVQPGPYQMEPKDEMKYLENVAAQLKTELESITKRIEELAKTE